MDYKDLQAGQSNEHFWFKSKNELIDILMDKVCDSTKKLNILSLGTGTGDDLVVLNKFGKNYVIDIEKKSLSYIDMSLCKNKIAADACNIPYKNNFFDVVVSFDVFEHIKKDDCAVNEVFRVLKKNGVLIFSVPAFEFLFSSHDKALFHLRRYNKKTINILLKKFDNQNFYFWNSILFFFIAFLRILKKNAEPEIDNMKLPKFINSLFYKILKFENYLIKKNLKLPLGLSITGYCFKPGLNK